MISVRPTGPGGHPSVPRWLLGVAAAYAAIATTAVTSVLATAEMHVCPANVLTTEWLWECAVTTAAVTAAVVVAIGTGAAADDHAES
ncbi:hypothetical protein LX12_001780 [Williamsia serinedens]|uniref:Uncharacterized protein n=1 Tax=Williamsia serinedens TaxID=391736 RepID=A0ABT1H1X7_9NOCA|nr:hypothetical protein [Williamsia serinedens]